MRVTRAGAGAGVSTTIELRRLDRVSAAELAVRTICGTEIYRSSTLGDGVYQFTRVYRPKWATVTGWALTVGLLGAGYWILLIKRTEACTMRVSEERASVRVILTGKLLRDVYLKLQRSFEELEAALVPSSELNETERGGDDDFLPVRSLRPTLVTERDGLIDLVALERAESEREPTRRRRRRGADRVLELPEVQFENGDRVRVMGVVFVGRDPVRRDADGRAVEWFRVDGATGAVSETHFALRAHLGEIMVEDQYSATGTLVGSDPQTARRVRPLERVIVPAGDKIFFGDQVAVVVTDDERAGRSAHPPGASARV